MFTRIVIGLLFACMAPAIVLSQDTTKSQTLNEVVVTGLETGSRQLG